MLSPSDCDTTDFEKRGVHVFKIPEKEWSFLAKFHLFTPFFQQWQQVLCTDLDIVVQGGLHNVFDALSSRETKIYSTMEDSDILSGLKRWDTESEEPDHAAMYSALLERYPHVTKRMYNASFIFYTPSAIPSGMKEKLQSTHEEFALINPTNADQMIFNVAAYDLFGEASKNCACFFGCDYPENRVPSETRGWKGDEVPAILHYTRWHAPWIEKCICDDGQEMGGYRCHRLGRICHELYAENLAAFEEEFPEKTNG